MLCALAHSRRPATADNHGIGQSGSIALAGNTRRDNDKQIDMEHQHMKRISGIENKSLAHSLAAILLGSAFLASALVPALISSASANSDDAVVQKTPGGVSYVSGGVGTDSIDRLNSLASDFNLKLVFALTSGSYVSDVKVAIADAKGRTILDTTSDGPWLLTRLPAGNYQVVATLSGNAVRRQVAVGAAKLRTVDFRWVTE
jgi:hypothetical protein